MFLFYIFLAISVVVFFLKQWIHHGINIAAKRTLRYAIVIALISLGIFLLTAK